jgi:hypothetical protein
MSDSHTLTEQLHGTVMDFTPVARARRRRDGWSADQQRRFILALGVMGSAGHAARAVGMSRASAYRLREAAGAESFANAWDAALDQGRARGYDAAMERALNGVTIVRVHKGGSVSVQGGPDMRLVNAVLRDPPRAAPKR